MVKHHKELLFNPHPAKVGEVEIQMFGAERAKIARLFIAGNFSRRFDDAKKILEKVSEMDFKADYFLTPSGFVKIPWKFSGFDEALKDGKRWAARLLEGVEINAKQIFIGVDSYSSSNLAKPHVELSIACSPDPWHCTGKVYPTVSQKGLIRADIDSHFLELDERVVVLCCHDLTIFNPRSDSSAKGWRKEIKEEFREGVVDFKPEVALHHSHYTDTPFTWIASWRNLEKISDVRHYATSGVYYREGGVRAEIERTLELTGKGSVLDVVVDISC
ncbi:hypothetical protein Asulf_01361 [Archaeoglobus sulfaticallidus PM70-1]|uniref:Uncharacterized protein n=1 Tax=Archaeoglobus sulfaticallidus PM70-1 TaxID=387631 RepID=N0BGC7_9EURY|nr:hypothetical protein [Archaeoglobus sulfaticallidus]AGK61352.1 hypothetical protein Asulf_01361 [Archaeoglobus sulfaticallidus PM70-1]